MAIYMLACMGTEHSLLVAATFPARPLGFALTRRRLLEWRFGCAGRQ
jgi:hypothetical protein